MELGAGTGCHLDADRDGRRHVTGLPIGPTGFAPRACASTTFVSECKAKDPRQRRCTSPIAKQKIWDRRDGLQSEEEDEDDSRSVLVGSTGFVADFLASNPERQIFFFQSSSACFFFFALTCKLCNARRPMLSHVCTIKTS